MTRYGCKLAALLRANRACATAVLFCILASGAVAAQQNLSAAPSVTPGSPVFTAPRSSTPAMGAATAIQEQQNPLFGSVPSGEPTPGSITLTPLDAIDRGLKYNLALIFSEQATDTARGARYRALADVLPNLTGRVSESYQQINLAAFGFPTAPGSSGVIGPFAVFDARLFASGSLDLHNLGLLKARDQDIQAAQLNVRNARDLIVLVVGGTYMQALAGAARIASVEAQLKTAETLFNQARDMKNAGVVPGIDVLRAQVEMQVQQQRLLAARNDFDKQKLTLARIIGLPGGQQFTLVDQIPLTPTPPLTLDQALARAYRDRPDYQSAKVALRSAELQKQAAQAERLPSLQINADYGGMGTRPGTAKETYTAAAGIKVPIFQGGKVRGDVLQADALLRRRQSEAADLRARIDFEVRTAFLDLASTAEQVQVAQSSLGLAQQTLAQAQDRFRAGVTTNIEVVQAQEAVAATNENYINSTFAYNVAKLSLARALGEAERAVKEFLGGKQ